MAKKNQIVPQYIQDLSTGTFGEINEELNGEFFAYFINPKTGWANGSRGSITFPKGDPEIKFLNDIQCAKLYVKLKEIRERSNGMVERKRQLA